MSGNLYHYVSYTNVQPEQIKRKINHSLVCISWRNEYYFKFVKTQNKTKRYILHASKMFLPLSGQTHPGIIPKTAKELYEFIT